MQETIDEWQLGYGLPTSKQKQQAGEYLFLESELLDANIYGKEGDRVFARFSDRLTFPIHSANGKLVGWSGRSLSGREDIAKYLNSPQSDVFDKSKLLYGLDKAKAYIAKEKEVVIVEGHIDVVLSHQAGFKNTVGTQGTALTMQHIESLKKYDVFTKLVFDGDKAGYAAAVKASILITRAGMSGEVIIMPSGLDPADMISSHSVDKYESILNNGIDCIRFILLDIINKYDLSKPHEKSKALDETIKFLNSLRDKIVANEYKAYLSMLLGVNINLINLDSIGQPQHQETKNRISLEQTLLYSMIESPQYKEYCALAREITHAGAWCDQEAFLELVSQNPNISNLRRIYILDDVVLLNKNEFTSGLRTLQRRYLVALKNQYINDLDVVVDINAKLSRL
ncbi:MAG: toprim domain-containing protein [Sulfurovaceae bacterium]|nr:toprim domain-containing protein [Sulfurovaceae bacterium]